MKKWGVTFTANTSVFITLDTDSPDEALDQMDERELVAKMIEQLQAGIQAVDFTVDEWEEITQ